MFFHRRQIYEYAKYRGFTDYLYPIAFALISYLVYKPNSWSFIYPLSFILFVLFSFRWHLRLRRENRYSSCIICNVLNVFLRGSGSALVAVTLGLPFVFLYMSAFAVFVQTVVESRFIEMQMLTASLVVMATLLGTVWLFHANMSDIRLATKQSNDERDGYIAVKAARTFAFGVFAFVASLALHFFGFLSFSFTIGSVMGFVISLIMFPLVVTVGLIKGVTLAVSPEGELVCSSLKLAQQSGFFDLKLIGTYILHFLRMPSEHPELFKAVFGIEPYEHWSSTAWNGSMNFATYVIILIAGLACVAA